MNLNILLSRYSLYFVNDSMTQIKVITNFGQLGEDIMICMSIRYPYILYMAIVCGLKKYRTLYIPKLSKL